MSKASLTDSICRVKQAEAVLSVWLERTTSASGDTSDLIGAILSLLNGVTDDMDAAEQELFDLDMQKRAGGKS
ncbi:hypothetical protein ACS6VG_002503 [Raoultella planticola]